MHATKCKFYETKKGMMYSNIGVYLERFVVCVTEQLVAPEPVSACGLWPGGGWTFGQGGQQL